MNIPLAIARRPGYIVIRDARNVCLATVGGWSNTREEDVANARLFAAAPAMRAALERVEREVRPELPNCPLSDVLGEVRSALEAAKGGQS